MNFISDVRSSTSRSEQKQIAEAHSSKASVLGRVFSSTDKQQKDSHKSHQVARDHFDSKNSKPDLQPQDYTQKITQLVENQQVSEAFDIFKKMKQNGIKPNILIYNSLILGVGKQRKLEKIDPAISLLEEMKKEGIRPNKFTYRNLIKTCGRVRDMESALTYYRIMK
jgi:pentatricopeptide repeat protein